MSQKYKSIETKLIHAGEASPRIKGAVVLPVFQSSTYEYSGEASYHDVKYIRLNNTPNHHALHEKLAALENAEAAIVTASGMAAISTALLAVLSAGDHVLMQDCLYGGTHDLVTKDFAGFGLSYTFINGDDAASWQEHLRPNTKAIYVEAMTNPMLQVADLKAVPAFAREHKLIAMIDNTFASPVNFRPAEWGFDVALHSATKYLNGHSDIVAGAAIGRADLIEKIKYKLDHLGGSLDPHAAFLLHRGLKTLALRVAKNNDNALQLAQLLEAHPAVQKVNYAGLESYERYARARELFSGFGGVLSFELKGDVAKAEAFMSKVQLPIIAPSLGGVETLMTRPVTTSHAGMSAEDRKKAGISDTLIRVAVGIEGTEDLLEDFRQALED
jgi:cystathionine beta-lyase/cystathionine gamma-synthase